MSGPDAEALPRTHTDRLTVQWVAAARRGGFHYASIYFWTSEGLSERNLFVVRGW